MSLKSAAALVLGAIVLSSWFASPAQAAIAVDSLHLEATLQQDGSVAVSQRLALAGSSSLDWKIFSNIHQVKILADNKEVPARDIRLSHTGGAGHLRVDSISASSWQISYVATSVLIRHDNRDQFFLKIFDNPGTSIGEVTASFRLPSPVEQQTLTGNVYAIGGVVGADQTVSSDQQIDYQASFAGEGALMTISGSWPRSLLALNSRQELRLALSNLDVVPWIVLGLALPLAALIVLIFLLLRQRWADRIKVVGQLDQPPTELSPLIVGVLVNKKIYPEEIVALIVDLCQRGYLVLVKKDNTYLLGRRRLPDQYLQPFEAEILAAILPEDNLTTNDESLQQLSRKSLFNPDVRRAFEQAYQVTTETKYFKENPHLTRVRYKLIGLIFYFVSVVGMIWTAVTDATPYLIIPLAGTLLLAWLIFRLTGRLISYTETGNRERGRWLAFGRFLGKSAPLDPRLLRNQTFEHYLPYAIVLHQTKAWAKRFDQSSTVPVKPDWFIAYEEMTTLKFAEELVAFTGQISSTLSHLRGPLVS